jgi:YVTN family beta-propeller protein
MDPSGNFVYVTTNGDGHVAKIDAHTGEVVARTATGVEPRTMDIAADGQSLYVVNYTSNTVSKLATDDLRVLQTVDTPSHPIGIAYEPVTSTVWVACYSGEILVYRDA